MKEKEKAFQTSFMVKTKKKAILREEGYFSSKRTLFQLLTKVRELEKSNSGNGSSFLSLFPSVVPPIPCSK
jgi:hypothetical protein